MALMTSLCYPSSCCQNLSAPKNNLGGLQVPNSCGVELPGIEPESKQKNQ
jgi:hypothetical protein